MNSTGCGTLANATSVVRGMILHLWRDCAHLCRCARAAPVRLLLDLLKREDPLGEELEVCALALGGQRRVEGGREHMEQLLDRELTLAVRLLEKRCRPRKDVGEIWEAWQV